MKTAEIALWCAKHPALKNAVLHSAYRSFRTPFGELMPEGGSDIPLPTLRVAAVSAMIELEIILQERRRHAV
ncbi:MAG: hypothetical protein HIU82_02250 [Proteobacteria bacterium]|nr:hypothetical protein [Pseudomonadota bacterium]